MSATRNITSRWCLNLLPEETCSKKTVPKIIIKRKSNRNHILYFVKSYFYGFFAFTVKYE
jgi:hypothetical protein